MTSGKKLTTAEEAFDVCRRLEIQRGAMARYPVDRTLDLLDRLGRIWGDPELAARKKLLATLPDSTGFSPEMLRLAFDELASILNRDHLARKLRTELRGYPRQGDFASFDPNTGARLAWHPLGTLFHVLSGNVFLVGAGSLAIGAITGNVNILKMSSGETAFLPRLLETLAEIDRDGVLTRSNELVEFSSSSTEVKKAFQETVDGILVWGGEEAVRAYRDGSPSRVRVVLYGPKLSVGIVTSAGLARVSAEEVGQRLAHELAIWDQNACTAPQVCYVQGTVEAEQVAAATAAALAKVNVTLPPGAAGPDTATEIQKWRGVYEVAEARGEAKLFQSPRGVDWTVIYDTNPEVKDSPLHRTLRIVPYREFREVRDACLLPMRTYVQTIGLCAGTAEISTLVEDLGHLGVLRILDLGEMSTGGMIDEPHDGLYDLPQLMNLVVSHVKPPDGNHPQETRTSAQRAAEIDERFRDLVRLAARTPFYAETLARPEEFRTIADLAKLPVLTKAQIEANTPPGGTRLLGAGGRADWRGGYVTRSGGSTGEPKFSYLSGREWEELLAVAVRNFRAMGLKPGDRMANFMLAGDLYGSFVSFDHINRALDLVSFNFAQSNDPEFFAKVARQFEIRAVEGMPSTLIPLLRGAKRQDPAFRLDTIIYAGMPMAEAELEWMRRELGAKRIASVIGTTETGQYAYQCEAQTGRFHHLVDDYVYVEIVDEDAKPVAPGEAGKILVTALRKTSIPTLRYEIGDRGRILPASCRCGRTERVLEFLGRADDLITIGLMNLEYAQISAALASFPISVLQVQADSASSGEILILRAESDRPDEIDPAEVRQALFAKIPVLAKRISEKAIGEIRVETLPSGALPRNPRTGKVRLVEDLRLGKIK